MKGDRDRLGWTGLMAAFALAAAGHDEATAIRLGRRVKARFQNVERNDRTARQVVRMVAQAARRPGPKRRGA
jgi:hypothetical protein